MGNDGPAAPVRTYTASAGARLVMASTTVRLQRRFPAVTGSDGLAWPAVNAASEGEYLVSVGGQRCRGMVSAIASDDGHAQLFGRLGCPEPGAGAEVARVGNAAAHAVEQGRVVAGELVVLGAERGQPGDASPVEPDADLLPGIGEIGPQRARAAGAPARPGCPRCALTSPRSRTSPCWSSFLFSHVCVPAAPGTGRGHGGRRIQPGEEDGLTGPGRPAGRSCWPACSGLLVYLAATVAAAGGQGGAGMARTAAD